jgi:hypothetical protein
VVYTTGINLNAGVKYNFQVKERNNLGKSALSDEITIMAASVPRAPGSVTTRTDQAGADMQNIIITWTAPFDGGSPLSGYLIFIRESSTTVYRE